MDLITALIGVIAALAGALFYTNSKRKTAEALNDNLDTKEKLLEGDKTIAEKEGQMSAEEAKRKELENKANEDKKNVDLDALKEFFNRPPNA